MPNAILNNADWQRSAEILYRGQEYTSEPLKSSYTPAANPIRPGFVAVIRNGIVELADQAVDNGAFFGLFYSEITTDLDELDRKSIPPVLIRGPGTVKVLSAALDSGSTYAVSAATVVELIAVNGKLTPRAAQTGPTVAHLTKVLSDGIQVQLLASSSV